MPAFAQMLLADGNSLIQLHLTEYGHHDHNV
jgi:hypothetical protein